MEDEKFKFECQNCGNVFTAHIGDKCPKCGSTDVKIMINGILYNIFGILILGLISFLVFYLL